MSTTNTDAVSIIVTLLGCGLAIYGIVSEPLVVDSTRPTQTAEAGQVPAEVPAYARLWDDPFAVYQDTDKVKPPAPTLSATGRTLFLIVPTKTQPYEDDIENRIRIRYAIERALFDQGYAAEAGNLLSTIPIGPFLGGKEDNPDSYGFLQASTSQGSENKPGPENHSLPIQIFRLCPLTAQLSVNTGHKPFETVAVVWLPDAHLWEETPLATIQSIYAAFPRPKANLDQDRWVLLGPSVSDSFAYFKSRSQENSRSPDAKPAVLQISNPGGYPRKLWLIRFRAMATAGAACPVTEKDYYADLSKSITTELAQAGYQNLLPCPQRSIRITLIPYLRGLDGASTLYRKNYVALRAVKEGDKEKPDHNQNSHDSIEPAEGTTQFDYIRRLVNSMYLQKAPFWPQVERPDAIVIFGTDCRTQTILGAEHDDFARTKPYFA